MFKTAYYITCYFEPGMLCLAGPIMYWKEILITGELYRQTIWTTLGISLPPGTTELVFTLLFIPTVFSSILHINIFLIIMTAKLVAAYWILERKLA